MSAEHATREIPFNEIKIPKHFNVRQDEPAIEELAESIKAQGLLSPLGVTDIAGDVLLTHGFRRYAALKKLHTGSKTVPVILVSYENGADAALANVSENTNREGVHPADLAERFEALEAGDYPPLREGEETPPVERKTIALRTGLSVSHIGNLVRTKKKLEGTVFSAWKKLDIPINTVIEWASLPDFDAQVEALEKWKAAKKRERESAKGNGNGHGEGEGEGNGDEAMKRRPTKKQIDEAYAKLVEKKEAGGLGKVEQAELDGKVRALRWCLGEVQRLS